jgi:hypothetical protein
MSRQGLSRFADPGIIRLSSNRAHRALSLLRERGGYQTTAVAVRRLRDHQSLWRIVLPPFAFPQSAELQKS